MTEVDEHIETCKTFKAKGDEKFKEKNYVEALKWYSRVFPYVRIYSSPSLPTEGINNEVKATDEQIAECKKLRISSALNGAKCNINIADSLSGDRSKSSTKYTCAMSLLDNYIFRYNEENDKAVMLRGVLNLKLGNIDSAKSDLSSAIKKFSTDEYLRRCWHELQLITAENEAKYRSEQQRMFGGMFINKK